MKVPIFVLERNQTLYENDVRINLTESGVHPCSLSDFLDAQQIAALAAQPLGYGHTDGRPALRRAIADWYPGAGPEHVLVANGSSEANLLALMALAQAGDEIIVLTPNFLQLDGIARAFGITVKTVALRREEGWQPDLAAVAAAVTPRTRLITLCDPNNPTGVRMHVESLRGLAALSTERDLWLHIDEIYRGAEIDGGPAHTSFGLGPKVIVSGGLSKAFGCPGLRLGWLIAPPALVAECHARQDYTTIGSGCLSQLAGEALLAPAVRDRILARGQAILARGRGTVETWAHGRNDWALVRPDAGGMAFLAYAAPIASEAFVAGLREKEGVFVCAGAWFGLEGHVRVGIGVEHEDLVEGLAAIDRFMARRGS